MSIAGAGDYAVAFFSWKKSKSKTTDEIFEVADWHVQVCALSMRGNLLYMERMVSDGGRARSVPARHQSAQMNARRVAADAMSWTLS
jgi:hypothetical protein